MRDMGYVPENPRPYGTSTPRHRSQPIRIHRSSSSRSTWPASSTSPGRDEFLSAADGVGESPTGDGSGALDAAVVTALRHLAEMINQGPEFGAISRLAGL